MMSWVVGLRTILAHASHCNVLTVAFILVSLLHSDRFARYMVGSGLYLETVQGAFLRSVESDFLSHGLCCQDPLVGCPQRSIHKEAPPGSILEWDSRRHWTMCQRYPIAASEIVVRHVDTLQIILDMEDLHNVEVDVDAVVAQLWLQKWRLHETSVALNMGLRTLVAGGLAFCGYLFEHTVLTGQFPTVTKQLFFLASLCWLDVVVSLHLARWVWPSTTREVVAYLSTPLYTCLISRWALPFALLLGPLCSRTVPHIMHTILPVINCHSQWLMYWGFLGWELTCCSVMARDDISDAMSHGLFIVLGTTLAQKILFLPLDTADLRRTAFAIDQKFSSVNDKIWSYVSGSTASSSAEDEQFRHELMGTLMLQVLPVAAHVGPLIQLMILGVLSTAGLLTLIGSCFLSILLCPWPELMRDPRGICGDDNSTPPQQSADQFYQSRVLTLLKRFTPLVLIARLKDRFYFAVVAFSVGVRGGDVKHVFCNPVRYLRYVRTSQHAQTTTGARLLGVLMADLKTCSQSPLPPQQAHLFPVTKVLRALLFSARLDQSTPLSGGDDIRLLNGLVTSLLQATQQANIRCRILEDPSFFPLLGVVVQTLRLWLVTGTELTADRLEYTLVPVTVKDPPLDGPPLTSHSLEATAQVRRGLEGCYLFMSMICSLLSNPMTGDPDDFGLAKLAEYGMLQLDNGRGGAPNPLRSLFAFLPQLMELVIWREGPGEATAIPALRGTLMANNNLAIQRPSSVAEFGAIQAAWIGTRGAIAEVAARLWLLTNRHELDALQVHKQIVFPMNPTSGFLEHPAVPLTLGDWISNRFSCQQYVRRLVYMIQRRFFRGAIPIPQFGQLVLLLRVVWRGGGSGSEDGNDAMLRQRAAFFESFVFEENEASFGIVVNMEPANAPGVAAVAHNDARIPSVLQSCNGKPVLLYVALMLVKALEDVHSNTFSVDGFRLRPTFPLVHIARCLEMVAQLAADRVPFAADRIVPLLVRVLSQSKEGLASLRRHITETFSSPRHGGIFVGDVRFIEQYFVSSIGMSIVATRFIGALIRALAAYSHFTPPDWLRLHISDFMSAVPMDKVLLQPVYEADEFHADAEPPEHQQHEVLPRQTYLFRLHRAEVELWTRNLVSYWDRVSRASFRVMAFTSVVKAKLLRNHVISTFQFPPSVHRLRAEEVSSLPLDTDCVICLELLHQRIEIDEGIGSMKSQRSQWEEGDPQQGEENDGREANSRPNEQADWEVNESLGGAVSIASCGHKFHAHCFFYWLCGNHSDCPLCRRPL